MKEDLHTKAYYHLPGLFEFYDFYKVFLPIYSNNREFFYEWCEIGSVYGAPGDCLWGGGRVGYGEDIPEAVINLMAEYNISSRLTFSNSLISKEHLTDKKCNELCKLFEGNNSVNNGVIVVSDCLVDYLTSHYPKLYLVSSTTKVLSEFNDFKLELDRDEYSMVVADFRLNNDFDKLLLLNAEERSKSEFLVNECCNIACNDRKHCYETVSKKSLGKECEHKCKYTNDTAGYRFSKAMDSPAFIGIEDILNNYIPNGFCNFKIEGRSLGSAILLEFILYYMVKPEYQLKLRELIYLDSNLDLF